MHINATNIEKLIAAARRPHRRRGHRQQPPRRRRAGPANRAAKFSCISTIPTFGYAITAEDIAAVIRERFFEVYNGHPGVDHLGDEHHASVEQIWDIANTIRLGQLNAPPLFGVATDDSHHYHGKQACRPGRGWIMVRAAKLEPETLISAIKAGDFYASSGVTLRDVRYDAEQETLASSISNPKTASNTPRNSSAPSSVTIPSPSHASTAKANRSARRANTPTDVGQVLRHRQRRVAVVPTQRRRTLRPRRRHLHQAAQRPIVQRPAPTGLDPTRRLARTSDAPVASYPE